jgi:hypothetical protein
VKTVGSFAIAVVLALSFVGFVAMHAVSTHVETESYFADLLDSTDFYRRLYDEVLVDPELAPVVDALAGGVDIAPDRLVETMKQLVDPKFLQDQTRLLTSRFVAHFVNDKKIDMTVDITPIVHRVRAFALDTAKKTLARIKYEHVASFAAFKAELERIVHDFKTKGAFPRALPTFEFSHDEGEEFAQLLVEAAHLSPDIPAQAEVIAAIRAGADAGDVQRALQIAGPALLESSIDESIRKLTHNDYVATVQLADGAHYILGPSGDVHEKIERELAQLRKLDRAAAIGRIICASVFGACVALLVVVHRRRASALLGWLGGAFVGAGALGFFGWLAVRALIATSITRAAAHAALPRSLQDIVRDLVRQGVEGFTRSIWIPSAAIAGLGVALVAGAIAARRR